MAPRTPDEIHHYLHETLLPAPPSRVTQAVESWAAEQGLSDAEDLLGLYGRAYEERRAAALSVLCEVAKAADGRRSLVSLLNRTDIADSERLLALNALDGQIDSMDIGSIVGAVINQRPAVAVAAAELIAKVPSGETLFFDQGSWRARRHC